MASCAARATRSLVDCAAFSALLIAWCVFSVLIFSVAILPPSACALAMMKQLRSLRGRFNNQVVRNRFDAGHRSRDLFGLATLVRRVDIAAQLHLTLESRDIDVQ